MSSPDIVAPTPGAGPDDDVVRNWFVFHPATAATGPVHDQIRTAFRVLLEDLLEILPAGPDRTLALRQLQAAMWAANSCVANAPAP